MTGPGDASRSSAACAAEGASAFDPRSRSKLTRRDLPRFAGATLFDAVARALCEAECLPRKELYEAWEVARRVRRRFRGGRVLDLACGHGLVAHLALLLDDSSPDAIAVDTRLPDSAAGVAAALTAAWPRLRGRVELRQGRVGEVEARPSDLLISVHACGALTDEVLDRALAASARVAVLPCCQHEGRQDDGGLGGWLDAPLAIDVARAMRLRAAGYTVHTMHIPAAITEKNRLLVAGPEAR